MRCNMAKKEHATAHLGVARISEGLPGAALGVWSARRRLPVKPGVIALALDL